MLADGPPRSGTVALVGRANAGKSTLMNRWLGEKISIVSDKPQTTRNRMVGILSEERGQMVFYDTPGVHKPLHRMNRQMLQAALDALKDADVVCLVVDAAAGWGRGEARLLETVKKAGQPTIVLLNKIDRMSKPALLPWIARYAEAGFEEIVPISALAGDGTDRVLELLWERLPEGPPLFDPELVTVHPERFLVAERIREKILEQTRDELPFSTAVRIERWEEGEDEKAPLRIYASLLVDRPGQKGILVGRGGQRIKQLGIAARRDLEEFLERRVRLDLFVKLEPGWREDRRILAELAIDGLDA